MATSPRETSNSPTSSNIRPPRSVWKGVGRIVRFLVVAYIAVILMLLWMENSLIYPAPQHPIGDWSAAKRLGFEEVTFNSADGTSLHGWYRSLPQSGVTPQAHLLYCHGNGENVAFLGDYLAELADEHRFNVLVFDYRGYGRSGGSPTEAGVLADGDAAQRWLAEREKLPLGDLVLMGRSLGGAVAVDLAAKNGCRGLILQSTFTSMPDAAAKLYPWAPVHWLMRNRYNSLDKLASYPGPLLQSHGDRDTLVPIDLGRRLHAVATGPKDFFVSEGLGHNDLEPASFQDHLRQFFASLPPLSTSETP